MAQFNSHKWVQSSCKIAKTNNNNKNNKQA